jgi:hypothetical protein
MKNRQISWTSCTLPSYLSCRCWSADLSSHHICSLVLDGELNLAPIPKNPMRVLDLGTGTGIWAMCASSRRCSEGFPWLTFKQ